MKCLISRLLAGARLGLNDGPIHWLRQFQQRNHANTDADSHSYAANWHGECDRQRRFH